MCTAGIRLPLAERALGEQPDIPHPFRFLRVTVSKSQLLGETTVTTCELAAYMLEMASFDDEDLDILTPGLFSARLNLSLKQAFH